MARPPKEFDKEGLIADWKTGRYEGRNGIDELSKKYGINRNKVYEITKEFGFETKELTDKIVSSNQELNGLSDKEFNSVIKHADRETRLKNRRDKIVNLAFDTIEERFQRGSREELSPMDIKALVDATDKTCVTAEIADRFNKNAGSTNIAQAGVLVNPLESLIAKTVGSVLRPNDQ